MPVHSKGTLIFYLTRKDRYTGPSLNSPHSRKYLPSTLYLIMRSLTTPHHIPSFSHSIQVRFTFKYSTLSLTSTSSLPINKVLSPKTYHLKRSTAQVSQYQLYAPLHEFSCPFPCNEILFDLKSILHHAQTLTSTGSRHSLRLQWIQQDCTSLDTAMCLYLYLTSQRDLQVPYPHSVQF